MSNKAMRLFICAVVGVFVAVLALMPGAHAVTATNFADYQVTCTTDANGFCTANHPAGVVPDSVIVSPAAAPAIMAVDQFTATTFRARFCRLVSSAGACTPLTGTRSFYVHVGWTPGGPPSPSPSVSPSASASPPPPPPPGGFPDASNTGVPAGTTLAVVNGDVTLSAANSTYDAKEVNGCITVTAPGVTITRVKVHCGGITGIAYYDGGVQTAPLTVQDSEVDCLDTVGRTAIGDTNITALRVNVHGCENGFDLDQWDTVRDSYIHDLANTGGSHTDGIQFAHYLNGCPTTACEVSHARNLTIDHNRIYGTGAQGAGTSAIISNPASDDTIVINNNLLAGGAYSLYCDHPGNGTNYQVTNNRVSRLFSSNGGAFGPWTDCTDETTVQGNVVSGNVWDDTGQPLP